MDQVVASVSQLSQERVWDKSWRIFLPLFKGAKNVVWDDTPWLCCLFPLWPMTPPKSEFWGGMRQWGQSPRLRREFSRGRVCLSCWPLLSLPWSLFECISFSVLVSNYHCYLVCLFFFVSDPISFHNKILSDFPKLHTTSFFFYSSNRIKYKHAYILVVVSKLLTHTSIAC